MLVLIYLRLPLKRLSADTKILHEWCVKQELYQTLPSVTCDFTFISGRDDVQVMKSFRDWQEIIQGMPQLVLFPGGHYFVIALTEEKDSSLADECVRVLVRARK